MKKPILLDVLMGAVAPVPVTKMDVFLTVVEATLEVVFVVAIFAVLVL